jgi:RNA polymerase sigma-70 factor, ECF subfamily
MHLQTPVNQPPRPEDDAINELFAQHYKASFHTALRILRSKEDSEDAVQAAYLAAFRAFHTFRAESSFNTWITRIVVNSCLGLLRKRRARPQVALDDIPPARPLVESNDLTPETLCQSRELRAAHASAASGLPRHLHEVYLPCEISGIALPEVAHRLGLTAVAAKSRLFRARRRVERTFRSTILRRVA